MLIALVRVRVPPFVAVLAAKRVKLVSKAANNALDRFSGFCRGNGDIGDMLSVTEVAVLKGPFVIGGEFAKEGSFWLSNVSVNVGAGAD